MKKILVGTLIGICEIASTYGESWLFGNPEEAQRAFPDQEICEATVVDNNFSFLKFITLHAKNPDERNSFMKEFLNAVYFPGSEVIKRVEIHYDRGGYPEDCRCHINGKQVYFDVSMHRNSTNKVLVINTKIPEKFGELGGQISDEIRIDLKNLSRDVIIEDQLLNNTLTDLLRLDGVKSWGLRVEVRCDSGRIIRCYKVYYPKNVICEPVKRTIAVLEGIVARNMATLH